MLDTEQAVRLPSARSLGKARQLEILVAILGMLLVVLTAMMVARHFLRPANVPAAKLPPGAFRPTPEQLAALTIEPARTVLGTGEVDATGVISVDEDRSTPIVLPFSGQVTDVLVQAGQHVTRGQPLLKIASPDFVEARNALFSAAAQRTTADAQRRTAEDNEKRQSAIYQTAGGALKDYRQAQNDLVAARSAARTADAALGAARDKLALFGKTPDELRRLESASEVAGIYVKTTFHAPVDGTLATRDVAPGQFLSAGGDKPVMTIIDLNHVWLSDGRSRWIP